MENESFDVVMFGSGSVGIKDQFFKGENVDLPLQRRGGKYKVFIRNVLTFQNTRESVKYIRI